MARWHPTPWAKKLSKERGLPQENLQALEYKFDGVGELQIDWPMTTAATRDPFLGRRKTCRPNGLETSQTGWTTTSYS